MEQELQKESLEVSRRPWPLRQAAKFHRSTQKVGRIMARFLLAICLLLATCSVANAQVYGALGYAPFGGYARTGSAMYGGFGSYYGSAGK